MPSRDVEINLIGNDRTGRATRSAANNLDRLAAKVDKFNNKSAKVNVDNNAAKKLEQTFAKAGAVAGKSFREKFRKFIGPAGLDADFVRGIKNIPNLYGIAGQKARDQFRKKFGPAGLDAQFVRDVKRIPVVFSQAGTKSKAAFRRAFTLGSAGLDPQFVADVKKIQGVFAAAGRRAGSAFNRNARLRVRVDTQVNRLRALGTRAGNVFSNAMASAINDGSRAIGAALKRALLAAPALQGFAAVLVARLLGFIGQALTAGFGLLVGPALLAAPIAFLLKKQLEASKQVTIQEKKVAGIKKRLEQAKSKDVQERLRKELAAEQRILREQQKQGENWIRLKNRAKDFLTFISAPIKVPFQKSLEAIGDGLDKLKGPMRDIMAALGPALAPFTKGVMDGLLAFIKALQPALPGIVAGMQAWGAAMPRIGKALGHMIAQIMKNPDAVVNSIEGIVTAIEDLAVIGASVIRVLTSIGNAFTTFGTNINALETGKLGQLTGFFRIFGTVAHTAVILALSALDALFSSLARIPFVGAIFQGAANQIHSALLKAQTDFANTKDEWARTDAAIRARQIKAKITADIADLKTKLATAKAKLKDPNLSKAKKVKIQADITDLKLKIATARALKVVLARKPSISKLRATMKDLQSKVSASKRSLDTVKNKKTEARIRANIAQAQAQIRAIKAQIAGVKGKTVTILARLVKQGFSRGGLQESVNRSVRSGTTWGYALNGGGTSRTGGPTPVNVEAPIVNTTVLLDRRVIRTEARSTVLDENRRAAFRARVGARR